MTILENKKIKKAVFGLSGQYGDLLMNQPSFDILRQMYPLAQLYMPIYKEYQSIAPIFFNQPSIDGLFITDGYNDDFPTNTDRKNASIMQFDLYYPPAHHRDGNNWFVRRHQVKDIAFSNNLPECSDKINLVKYWADEVKLQKTVAICPFGGNGMQHKSMTSNQIYGLINYLKSEGYDILQLCPSTNSSNYFSKIKNSNTSFIDSVKLLHRCDFLITVDTAMCWIASAYNIPTVALYSHEYYTKDYVKNIQPVNPNALYLSKNHISEINLEELTKCVKLLKR